MKNGRLSKVLWVYAGVLALVVGRLVQLQIVDHELWSERARRSRLEKRTIPAERGSVLDRRGRILAEDRRSYDLMFEYRAFRRGQVAGQLLEACGLLGIACGGLDSCLDHAEALGDRLFASTPAELQRLSSQARGDLLFYLRRLAGMPPARAQELRDWAGKGQLSFAQVFPEAQAGFRDRVDSGRAQLEQLQTLLGDRLEEPLLQVLEQERRKLERYIRYRALTTAAANALGLSSGEVRERLRRRPWQGPDLDHEALRHLLTWRLAARWQVEGEDLELARLLAGDLVTESDAAAISALLLQIERVKPEDVQGLRRTMAAQVHADRVARLLRRVDFEVVDRIGQDPEGYAGFVIEANPIRVHPDSVAPQIVGQVRVAGETDLQEYLDQRDELRDLARLLVRTPAQEKRYRALRRHFYQTTLRPGEIRGLTGIEAAYQEVLTGKRGYLRTLAGGEDGTAPRELEFEPPQRGHDVRLALDRDLVQAAERAIRKGYREARHLVKPKQQQSIPLLEHPKVGFALLDLRNGEVPMLATWPTFDYADLAEHYQDLVKDRDGNVFRHRALGGGFLGYQVPYPGSTFKVVVAIEALSRDPNAWNKKVYCGGSYLPPALSNSLTARALKCNNHAYGEMDMRHALKYSCNTYFYHLGQELGWEALWSRAHALGFGSPTGIELVRIEPQPLAAGAPLEAPDDPGIRYHAVGPNAFLVAGANHLKSRYDDFNAYTLSHFGIGQAIVSASPLQMARCYGWIASGKLLTPRLVLDGGGASPAVPATPEIPLDPLTAERLRDALRAVTDEPGGTAHNAEYPLADFLVAGKTGTAEPNKLHPTHAWFAGYFPWDAPRYSFAILCENVGLHGGQIASVILYEFLADESVQQFLMEDTAQ